MQPYRGAIITLWQTDSPDEISGTWSVFLRYGPRDFVTLTRGELTSSAPRSSSAEEWLLEALEKWLQPPT